jgi:hypothetical protein
MLAHSHYSDWESQLAKNCSFLNRSNNGGGGMGLTLRIFSVGPTELWCASNQFGGNLGGIVISRWIRKWMLPWFAIHLPLWDSFYISVFTWFRFLWHATVMLEQFSLQFWFCAFMIFNFSWWRIKAFLLFYHNGIYGFRNDASGMWGVVIFREYLG